MRLVARIIGLTRSQQCIYRRWNMLQETGNNSTTPALLDKQAQLERIEWLYYCFDDAENDHVTTLLEIAYIASRLPET
jgi:hypothetical protein